RADVLRTHRAVGLPDQAARVGELAKVCPVRADGEELVAVGIRAKGIAARVEDECSRRRVRAERQGAASWRAERVTSIHGVLWLGEVRELAQARSERADGEELAGPGGIGAEGIGRSDEDHALPIRCKARVTGIDTAEVRELKNVRPIQEENLGYRVAESGARVLRRARYVQRGSSPLNTSARDAEA